MPKRPARRSTRQVYVEEEDDDDLFDDSKNLTSKTVKLSDEDEDEEEENEEEDYGFDDDEPEDYEEDDTDEIISKGSSNSSNRHKKNVSKIGKKNKKLSVKLKFKDKKQFSDLAQTSPGKNSGLKSSPISENTNDLKIEKPIKIKFSNLQKNASGSNNNSKKKVKSKYVELEEDDLDLDEDDDENSLVNEDLSSDLDDEDLDEEGREELEADISKMTERQRSKYLGTSTSEEPEINTEDYVGRKKSKELLSLIDGPGKKKQLTEEEIQLRKLEAARKRKNFNTKKLEAEKRDTLNKLLMKRADKVRDLNNLQGKEYEEEGDMNQNKKENKNFSLIKHKALFNWTSTTEVVNNEKKSVSYYSML